MVWYFSKGIPRVKGGNLLHISTVVSVLHDSLSQVSANLKPVGLIFCLTGACSRVSSIYLSPLGLQKVSRNTSTFFFSVLKSFC